MTVESPGLDYESETTYVLTVDATVSSVTESRNLTVDVSDVDEAPVLQVGVSRAGVYNIGGLLTLVTAKHDYIRFNRLNHCYWDWNVCLNKKIRKCLVSNYTNVSNFNPLEVAGRGSDAQLQVGDNWNRIL